MGGSAARITNNHNSTDPGGGDIVAPTTKNKPAWVSPVANSRRPGWSPSVQAYPPLGCQRTIHSPKLIEGAGRKPRRPAQLDMEQIDPAIKDIRIVSGRDLPSPLTPVSGVRRVVRNMRPAGQNDKSPSRSGRNNIVTDENTNGVAGMGNSSDRHPEGGSISGIQLQGGVVGLYPERVSLTVVAETAVNVNDLEVDSGPPLSATGGGGPWSDYCWGGNSGRC